MPKIANALIDLKLRGIKAVSGGLDKLKAQLHTIGTVGKIAFAGVAGGLAMAVKTASGAQETASKFDAVFGTMKGEARTFAAEMSESFGRSQVDIESYLAQLQDTFVPLGFAEEKAFELSKQLAGLGIDLASFNDEADKDAIAKLTSGFIGNHEAVRSWGVIITEASLQQELLNMKIQGGVKNATAMDKVQARLNIIMGATTRAQGDAVRTSDSFANQLKRLKGEITDSAAAIGSALLPGLTALLKDLVPIAKAVGEWAARNADLIPTLALTTLGITGTLAVVTLLAPALTIIAPLVMKIGVAFKFLGKAMWALTKHPFIAALVGVVYVVGLLLKYLTKVMGLLGGKEGALGKVVDWVPTFGLMGNGEATQGVDGMGEQTEEMIRARSRAKADGSAARDKLLETLGQNTEAIDRQTDAMTRVPGGLASMPT